MRNIIEVDILTIDTKPYKTSFTQEMAYNEVYRGVFDLPKDLIHGIKCAWRGHPFISIKLAKNIDIDTLPAKFDYYRHYKEDDGSMGQYKIYGEVRGVRISSNNMPKYVERWLRIDPDCYDMDENMLLEWLKIYGSPLTKLEEDNMVVPAFDEDPEDEAGAGEVKLGKGLLSIKMTIFKTIPEFLPIDGKRVRIHYSGMPKQCLNCYGYNHLRQECKEGKTQWLEYVAGFMEKNKDIKKELFGRWYYLVQKKLEERSIPSTSRVMDPEKTITEKTMVISDESETENEAEYETGDEDINRSVPVLAAQFDKKAKENEVKTTEAHHTEKRARGRPKK